MHNEAAGIATAIPTIKREAINVASKSCGHTANGNLLTDIAPNWSIIVHTGSPYDGIDGHVEEA